MAMWVKVCGLRTKEAVDAAVESGADAIGFVFAEGSPRYVDPRLVRDLVASIPSTVETVAVVRDQPIRSVIAMARTAGVDTVQLHGSEPDSDLDRLTAEGLGGIRAISIDDYRARSGGGSLPATRLLIDAVEPGAGLRFDASLLVETPPVGRWILAGGLSPATVAEAIAALRPAGVDVSSGVESSRGVKSPELIREFVRAARSDIRTVEPH